jgi:hypothetical protein
LGFCLVPRLKTYTCGPFGVEAKQGAKGRIKGS